MKYQTELVYGFYVLYNVFGVINCTYLCIFVECITVFTGLYTSFEIPPKMI